MKIKWTALALKAYKDAGEEVKSQGAKAIREIKDPDCNTVLTMWAMPSGAALSL